MKKCNPLLPRWSGNGSCPTRRQRSSCRHSQQLLSTLALYGWKVNVLATQSCPTLSDYTDCSPPGSSVHGIRQVRILEWVAIPFSRGSSWPREWTWVSALQADSSPSETPGKPLYAADADVDAKSLQLCPTLCDSMHCSLPGSFVHGIPQVRTLEWLTCSPAGDLPDPGFEPRSLTFQAFFFFFFFFFTVWATRKLALLKILLKNGPTPINGQW